MVLNLWLHHPWGLKILHQLERKKIDFYKPSKHFLLFFSPTEAWTRVCVGLSLWFIRAGGLGWCVYTGYTSLSFCLCASDKQYFFLSSLLLFLSILLMCHNPPRPFLCSSPFSHTHTLALPFPDVCRDDVMADRRHWPLILLFLSRKHSSQTKAHEAEEQSVDKFPDNNVREQLLK